MSQYISVLEGQGILGGVSAIVYAAKLEWASVQFFIFP
jgi:hypothetical protein